MNVEAACSRLFLTWVRPKAGMLAPTEGRNIACINKSRVASCTLMFRVAAAPTSLLLCNSQGGGLRHGSWVLPEANTSEMLRCARLKTGLLELNESRELSLND